MLFHTLIVDFNATQILILYLLWIELNTQLRIYEF